MPNEKSRKGSKSSKGSKGKKLATSAILAEKKERTSAPFYSIFYKHSYLLHKYILQTPAGDCGDIRDDGERELLLA